MSESEESEGEGERGRERERGARARSESRERASESERERARARSEEGESESEERQSEERGGRARARRARLGLGLGLGLGRVSESERERSMCRTHPRLVDDVHDRLEQLDVRQLRVDRAHRRPRFGRHATRALARAERELVLVACEAVDAARAATKEGTSMERLGWGGAFLRAALARTPVSALAASIRIAGSTHCASRRSAYASSPSARFPSPTPRPPPSSSPSASPERKSRSSCARCSDVTSGTMGIK